MKNNDSKTDDHKNVIKNQIDNQLSRLQEFMETKASIQDAQDLEAMEKKITEATDKLAALMIGLKIQESMDSEDIENQCSEIIRAIPYKMKNQGPREVEIQTSSGKTVTIKIGYYSRSCLKGKKNRKGLYPILIVFGIYDRLTVSSLNFMEIG